MKAQFLRGHLKKLIAILFTLFFSLNALSQSCYQDISTEQFKEFGTQLKECFDEIDFAMEGEEEDSFCGCEKESSALLKRTSDYELIKKEGEKGIVAKSLLKQGQNEISEFLINLSVLEGNINFAEVDKFSCEFSKYIDFPKDCNPNWKEIDSFLKENISSFLGTKYTSNLDGFSKDNFIKNYNQYGEKLLSKTGSISGEKNVGNQCLPPSVSASMFFSRAELRYADISKLLRDNRSLIAKSFKEHNDFEKAIDDLRNHLVLNENANDASLIQELKDNPALASIIRDEKDFESFINEANVKKGLSHLIESNSLDKSNIASIKNRSLNQLQKSCESGAKKMAQALTEKFCKTDSNYKVWGNLTAFRKQNSPENVELESILSAGLYCEQREDSKAIVVQEGNEKELEDIELPYIDSLKKMNNEDVCKDLCVGGVAKAGCELKKAEDVTKLLESSDRCKGDKAKFDDYCLYMKSYAMSREREAIRVANPEVARPSIAATFIGKQIDDKKPVTVPSKKVAENNSSPKTTSGTKSSLPKRSVSSTSQSAISPAAAVATPSSDWTEVQNLWPGKKAKSERSTSYEDLKRDEANRKQMDKMADLATKAVDMASDMSKRRAEEIAEKAKASSGSQIFPTNFSNNNNDRNDRRAARSSVTPESSVAGDVTANDLANQTAANAAAEEAAARAARASGRSPASIEGQNTEAKTQEAEEVGPQVVVVNVSDIKTLSAETLKEQGIELERPFIINVVGKDGEVLEVNVEQIQHEDKTIMRPVVSVQNRAIYRDLLGSPLFEDYREFTLERDEERSLFNNILDSVKD